MIRIAFCQSNRLFILLERAETDISFSMANSMLKTKMDIDCHGPRLIPNNCKHLIPPHFSLPTNFNELFLGWQIQRSSWVWIKNGTKNELRNRTNQRYLVWKQRYSKNSQIILQMKYVFVLCVIYSLAVNIQNNRDVPYNDFPTINSVIFENHPVCLIKYEHKKYLCLLMG